MFANVYHVIENLNIVNVVVEQDALLFTNNVLNFFKTQGRRFKLVIFEASDVASLIDMGGSHHLCMLTKRVLPPAMAILHKCSFIFVLGTNIDVPRPFVDGGFTNEGRLIVNPMRSIEFKRTLLSIFEQTYIRDKPFRFLQKIADLVGHLGLKTVVEIGSCRRPLLHHIEKVDPVCCNDGHSTAFWTALKGVQVYTVDVDPSCQKNITDAHAQGYLKVRGKLAIHIGDGLEFLRDYDGPAIGLLFLDAWDVGFSGNPAYDKAHLAAFEAAESFLADTHLIGIDDTDVDGGGKGRLLVPHLLKKGYIILFQGRITLMYKGDPLKLLSPTNVRN